MGLSSGWHLRAGGEGSRTRCVRALEEPLWWVLGCLCQNLHFGGAPEATLACCMCGHVPVLDLLSSQDARGHVWHVVLDHSFRS